LSIFETSETKLQEDSLDYHTALSALKDKTIYLFFEKGVRLLDVLDHDKLAAHIAVITILEEGYY
jgi:hypothetical protein